MQQQQPADGVSGLLEQLVRTICVPATLVDVSSGLDSSSPDREVSYLHQLAVRLAQGGPRWRTPQHDEAQIVKQAQRDIAHRAMHVNREGGLQSAARFESLYREWRHLTSKAESIGAAPLVQRRGELLHLMQQLAGAADQPAGTATGYAAIINQSQQPTLRSLASPPAASGQQLVPSASVGGLHSSAVSHLQSSPPAKAPQRGSTSQLSEAELLRDILYILLGSDGNHVKYHAPTDAFLLLPSLRVDRPQRILVQRVCELGWLYRKVQSYVTDIMGGANGALALPSAGATTRRGGTAAAPTTIETPAEHSGKIEQSFAATLREELNEYIRFITLLETQVEKELRSSPSGGSSGAGSASLLDGGSARPAHDTAQFTLKRMLVFVQDAMQTLSLLAMLTDAARGVKGGQLASVIGAHLRHGDPFVVALMKRVMAKTCVPLFEMIDIWISSGMLNDPYSEFFVQSHAGIPIERLWSEKYSLRRTMIPAFLDEPLVHKILAIGKAVNFIRINCKDPKYTMSLQVDYKQMFASCTDLSSFTSSIDAASDGVNAHLLHLLTSRYHFLSHATALKRYLLLSAGDFAATLLELVQSELDKPARDLSTAQLLGLLESAKRTTSASTEPEEVIGRLSLKRLHPQADEDGWSLFTLAYHLDDSPLRVAFTERNLDRYLAVFDFLWKLKRVESALNGAWALQTKLGHAAALRQLGRSLTPDGGNVLEPFLRNVAGLRHEMGHFITNLHSYVMFEVLECAWDEFLVKTRMAPTQTATTTHARTKSTITNANTPSAQTAAGGAMVAFAGGVHSALAATTHAMWNQPQGGGAGGSAQPQQAYQSAYQPAAGTTPQAKPLDLDGLIQAHKLYLQQIVDKALMGGAAGTLYPQLLALFQHALQYSTFNDRLYASLHAEVERRAEADRAIAKSEASGKWTSASSIRSPTGSAAFLRALTGFVREFAALQHAFHTALVGFLRALRETNRAATLAAKLGATKTDEEEEAELAAQAREMDDEPSTMHPASQSTSSSVSVRARRAALHLHSLDFLRFRLDFSEFYTVHRKEHMRILARHEAHTAPTTTPSTLATSARHAAQRAAAPAKAGLPRAPPA